MGDNRFTVHIKWFNYDKTDGEIELLDNGQPLLVSDCVDDVQNVKRLLNKYENEKNKLKETLAFRSNQLTLMEKLIDDLGSEEMARQMEDILNG